MRRGERWGIVLAAIVAAAQLGWGAQAHGPRSVDPSAVATPLAPATPTPTSCVSDPPLVNPVTSPTDQLVQTITGYRPGLLCGRGGFISIDGVEVLSQSQNCTQGTFEATVQLQADETNSFDVCLHPGMCGSGGCTAVEIVHHTSTPAPEISVTPSTLSLECQGAFTITVASAGPPGSTLEISAITLAHGYSQGYYGTGFSWDLSGITLPASLPSGATLDIPVTFSAAGQPYPSRLELTVDSNAAGDPHLFLVYFGAVQEACEATPTPTATETATFTPTSNRPDLVAVAEASPNPATAGVTVTLDGSHSSGAYVDGYEWTQAAGPAVTIVDANSARAMFMAPPVVAPTTLTFMLHITGFGGSPPVTSAWTMIDVLVEPSLCLGDCNGDGRVTIDELVKGVNIALGTLPFEECPRLDCDGSGGVSVDCLIGAVSRALDGC